MFLFLMCTSQDYLNLLIRERVKFAQGVTLGFFVTKTCQMPKSMTFKGKMSHKPEDLLSSGKHEVFIQNAFDKDKKN